MSYFITGTDTGVGKTVVTACLAHQFLQEGFRVCVYKPLQTGSVNLDEPEDPGFIQQWLGPSVGTFCSYNFHPPVAPYVADMERSIRLEKIQEDFQQLQKNYEVVLVEGAGGVRVPIAPGLEIRDLMCVLDLPVIVVARPHLGTINHTLLTVEALQGKGLDVTGVIVSGYPQDTEDLAIQTLPQVFEAFLPVPVLAWLPVFDLQEGLPTISAKISNIPLNARI